MTKSIATQATEEAKALARLDAAAKRFVRNRTQPENLETLRLNLILARNLQGYTAVEAAEKFGYSNSTQLSLMESGERPVPKDHQFIRQASQIYAVSCDWLLGLSPHADLDSKVGQQFAMMRGMEDILRRHAAEYTTAVIVYTEQTMPTQQDVKCVDDAVADIAAAVKVMQEKYNFDEIRGSAPVLAAVERAMQAIVPLRRKMTLYRGIEEILAEFKSGKRRAIQHLLERYSQRDLNVGG